MGIIYIVRHGKTDWNNKGILQGHSNIELNNEGIKEVSELVKQIDVNKIDVCFSSPLKRAVETAKIIMKDNPIILDDLLIERCYGDLEGKTIDYEMIQKHWNYDLNYSEDNIENIQKILRRASMFLEKIKKEYKDKTILVVSHGSLIKALHFNLIGYDKNTDFLSFNPQNSTIYKYEI